MTTTGFLVMLARNERHNAAGRNWRHDGLAALVLAEGIPMHREPGHWPAGHRHGRPKLCYMNAAHMAQSDTKRFVYCEGYASSSLGLPLPHAWVWDRRAHSAVDPTWKDGTDYHGIAFKHSYLCRVLMARQCYGVIDNYQQGFPLITKTGVNPATYIANTRPANVERALQGLRYAPQ